MVVEGETGTGKEVFARAAHAACARAQKPFVAVNCAALPETLIEAEFVRLRARRLHGRSAHGAKGLLRQAEGGLLFLDEIGDMPLALQSRLLRALQEREVLPVGGTRPVPVDFALICATHRDLSRMVEEGAFRADLFYRIAPYRVRLAPLRDRPDRLALVRALWARSEGPARNVTLSPSCEAALAEAEWPGNLRQLAACLKALAVLAEAGEVLGVEDLPEGVAGRRPRAGHPPGAGGWPPREHRAGRDADGTGGPWRQCQPRGARGVSGSAGVRCIGGVWGRGQGREVPGRLRGSSGASTASTGLQDRDAPETSRAIFSRAAARRRPVPISCDGPARGPSHGAQSWDPPPPPTVLPQWPP